MIRVELKELQANLQKYMKLLDKGEQIEVLENGKVIYALTESLTPPKIKFHRKRKRGKRKRRVLGRHAGWIEVPDNICDLPQEIIDSFYTGSLVSPKVNPK